LKTKDNVFPTTIEAKRYMKINGLFLESQEVVDSQGFNRLMETQRRSGRNQRHGGPQTARVNSKCYEQTQHLIENTWSKFLEPSN
jgi:hypothetical protein